MKKLFKQFLFAYAFLTIIPGLGKIEIKPEDTGKSTLFYPIVGMTIGFGLYPISLLRALTPLTLAVLMCIYILIFSRALHADGLIDTIDGFLSGKRGPDLILSVMRDSRLGALGFIGAFSLYLVKICMFYEILIRTDSFIFLLVAVPALSRGGVALAGCMFPYAGGEGLGKEFVASIGIPQAVFSFLFMLLFSFSKDNHLSILSAPLVALFWVLWGFLCRGKIGGITGDTIGAGIELAEVFGLILIYGFFS